MLKQPNLDLDMLRNDVKYVNAHYKELNSFVYNHKNIAYDSTHFEIPFFLVNAIDKYALNTKDHAQDIQYLPPLVDTMIGLNNQLAEANCHC